MIYKIYYGIWMSIISAIAWHGITQNNPGWWTILPVTTFCIGMALLYGGLKDIKKELDDIRRDNK